MTGDACDGCVSPGTHTDTNSRGSEPPRLHHRPPPRLLASSRGGAGTRAYQGTRALPAPGPGPRVSPVPGRCESGPWRALDPAECDPHPALSGIGPWLGSRDADWVPGWGLEAPPVPATSAVEEVRWAYYKTRSLRTLSSERTAT